MASGRSVVTVYSDTIQQRVAMAIRKLVSEYTVTTAHSNPSPLTAFQRCLHPAVLPPIQKVHDQTDRQPNNQSCPVHPSQLVHHVPIEKDTENRNKRNPGRAERARLCWIRMPQHHHSHTNDDEGQ